MGEIWSRDQWLFDGLPSMWTIAHLGTKSPTDCPAGELQGWQGALLIATPAAAVPSRSLRTARGHIGVQLQLDNCLAAGCCDCRHH